MMEGVGYRKYGIERTKTGLPAVWEAGGGYTNTGWARVVANKYGAPEEGVTVDIHQDNRGYWKITLNEDEDEEGGR